MADAAIGFRIKTGRAIAVLMTGTAGSPVVVDRSDVQLSDPTEPASRFPYHAALDLAPAAGARETARLTRLVERFSKRSLAEMFERYGERGHRLRRAGLVVGGDADPATIKGAHIRAHAEEGKLYRVQVEQGVAAAGLRPIVTREKALLAEASKALGTSPDQIKKKLTALGKGLPGPWRSEEKQAA